MAVYLGRGAYIGIGKESDWGTAVARSRWMRANSVGIVRKRVKSVVPHLNGPSLGSRGQMHFVPGSDRVSGSFTIPVDFDDYVFSELLEQAFGGVSTSGPDGNSMYTHAFAPTEALLAGLTIEQGKGTGHAEVFEGCKVNRLTIAAQAPGGTLTCTADIIGETTGGPTSVGSPTFTTHVWMEARHAGQFTWNSVAYDIKSIEIVIDNHLEEDDKLGSLNTTEPLPSAPTEFTARITVTRTSNALQAAHEADTQADGSIAFTSGNRSLTFNFYNAIIDDYSGPDTVSGPGRLEESFTLRCFVDASDEGLEISLVNGNSAAV